LLENLDHLITMTFAVPEQIEDDDVQQSFPQLSLPIVQIQNAPRYSYTKTRFSVRFHYAILQYTGMSTRNFIFFSKIFPVA
jgi:hypothetical protein